MKSTVEDEQIKDKISEKDRTAILEKCNEAISWLDSNQMAETEEFKHKLQELETVCKPIISKLYQQTGNGMPAGAGSPGTGCGPQSNGGPAGPTIDEVD